MKKRNILSPIVTLICLATFLYAAYGLGTAFYDYYTNRKMLKDLQEQFYVQPKQRDDQVLNGRNEAKIMEESLQIRQGFENLLEQNDELIGWITVPGTVIDYPVLQADNNVDYLTKTFYGTESRAGSIFLDYRNNIQEKNQNWIIYGHRMRDGTMFQQLTKYLDEDFFEENRMLTFDTLYDQYEAEIFAVFRTLTDFNYIKTHFEDEEEFSLLIYEMKKRSLYDAEVEVNKDDQIITLSTCDSGLDPEDGRLVVVARVKNF